MAELKKIINKNLAMENENLTEQSLKWLKKMKDVKKESFLLE